MKKIKYIVKKLGEHHEELGTFGTMRWLVFAIKFRTLSFVTRGRVHIKGEGNIKQRRNNANLLMKDGRRVFIFATIPYYDIGGGQRSAQLAKMFNLMGYEVYYIYGADSSESVIYHMEIPTIRHLFIDVYREDDFEQQVRMGDVVILEFPNEKFLPFVEIAKRKKASVVYENIDNWETSLSGGRFNRSVLREILNKSDLLVGTAKPLIRQLKDYLKEFDIKKKIIYAPNAVDDSVFDPRKEYEKPDDFIAGQKTLIYYGSLWGEWFDWDLVFGIAKKNPKYSILLIGEEKCVMEKVRKAPKNVHFLGIKKQADLPAYLKFADIALIPFKVDKIGKYVSPLKIFEYISMDKVVISTSLPEVKGYPNTLIGDTVDEWNKLLKKDVVSEHTLRNEFVDNNTWCSRGNAILDGLGMITPKCAKDFYGNISVIVLNYNNKNCIFDCVDSLLRFKKRYNYDVIVVDNNSTDGSYEGMKKKYKDKIDLIRNSKNGCSSGRNLGVKAAKTDYVLFLDSDQFALHDCWLDVFIELEKRGTYGAIGWSGGWIKPPKIGMSTVVEGYPYRYVPADVLARTDLEYLATDGFLVRKKVLEEVGGFDEIFDPTCFEDTDLSFAIRNIGLELAYCPYLGIYHLPHQTTKSGSAAHDRMLREHEKKFIEKWTKLNKSLFITK